ncbi:hypothetical protein G9A89_023754 [Geosiphon pyriformis]|nr:hypothetical protein G9A89_023754 [Geosiphon pyriformis]
MEEKNNPAKDPIGSSMMGFKILEGKEAHKKPRTQSSPGTSMTHILSKKRERQQNDSV